MKEETFTSAVGNQAGTFPIRKLDGQTFPTEIKGSPLERRKFSFGMRRYFPVFLGEGKRNHFPVGRENPWNGETFPIAKGKHYSVRKEYIS